ncbi:MAG: hypothetical protein IKY97_00395 [Mailhella sp.]|nr:hypothetical protein [Mailhella sp.]
MPVIVFPGRLTVKFRELEILVEDVPIFGGNAVTVLEGCFKEVVQPHSERLVGNKLDELGR